MHIPKRRDFTKDPRGRVFLFWFYSYIFCRFKGLIQGADLRDCLGVVWIVFVA